MAANFEEIRSLAFGSITAGYVAVGDVTAENAKIVCFTNDTDASMMFSIDGSTDQIFVKSQSFKLFDIASAALQLKNNSVLAKKIQFYVRYLAVPTQNSVYIEVMY